MDASPAVLVKRYNITQHKELEIQLATRQGDLLRYLHACHPPVLLVPFWLSVGFLELLLLKLCRGGISMSPYNKVAFLLLFSSRLCW